MKEKLIMSIVESKSIDDYRKKDFIDIISKMPMEAQPSFEIEKYKIDKMLEAGLIKESNISQRERMTIVNSLLDKKVQWAYIATLSFLLMLFNSKNFWSWMMANVGLQK
jgi:hypothetical protein